MAPRPKLTKEAVRAYLDRPWHLFEEAHDHFARERQSVDPGAAFRRSEELWEQMRQSGGLGRPEARREDFEHHLRLRQLLDRT